MWNGKKSDGVHKEFRLDMIKDRTRVRRPSPAEIYYRYGIIIIDTDRKKEKNEKKE